MQKLSLPISFSSILFSLCLVALSPNKAAAQFYVGSQAMGTGGAGRAAVDEGEVGYLNPASVAFIHNYSFTLNYGTASHPALGNLNEYAVSIADGTSEGFFPGSLSYVRRKVDDSSGVSDTQQDIQLNFAGRLMRKVAVGLAGHRLTDQILAPQGPAEYNQWNMHLGLIYAPKENLAFGAVAYDMLPSESTPSAYRVVPTLGVGVTYIYEKFFRARLDLVRPDFQPAVTQGRRINILAGLETSFTEFFIFRFGGAWVETRDQDYLTLGLGYKGPRLSFDYSFQKDARCGENSRHLIDLWLPI